MRKPRDYDAELKALGDKATELKNRKVQQLGELVIATGGTRHRRRELAGALIVLAETTDAGKAGGMGQAPSAGPRSFRGGQGGLHRRRTATMAALKHNRVARNRHQAARARHDMRMWQVERHKRTRRLTELGVLVFEHHARDVRLTEPGRAFVELVESGVELLHYYTHLYLPARIDYMWMESTEAWPNL